MPDKEMVLNYIGIYCVDISATAIRKKPLQDAEVVVAACQPKRQLRNHLKGMAQLILVFTPALLADAVLCYPYRFLQAL